MARAIRRVGFWAGTLADDHRAGGGALYRLDRDSGTELILDGLTTIAQGSIDPSRWPAKLARTEEGTQWLCALKTTL